ncbi:IS1 family transposase, partial [Clostridium butyricum]|nr:transposase [Clostridium butyricum]NFB73606.1 IS1 family transposase [Clostridium butyricum]NFB93036.1 IS1 family transposase [Clostridium butyricum]
NVKKYKECPYCGSKSFIKYGNYNRIQRYKCKNEECKKTFSNTTNSVWKYLKHKPEKWFEFIELMGEHTTLNECAAKLEISIVTAFYWRHKIFHAIENNYKPEKFDEVVDVDTYYTEKCYKGSRNKN